MDLIAIFLISVSISFAQVDLWISGLFIFWVKFYYVAICDMEVGKQWELLIGLISLSGGMSDSKRLRARPKS